MTINLITNFADRKGLWRDGCLLDALLSSWGHQCTRVQFNAPSCAGHADLNIFLETLRPDLFPLARWQWWVPNLEWITEADLAYLPSIDCVLCKTGEAERALTPLTDRAVYTGWESEDRYDPTVPREMKVLHVAGGSILKGTQTVLDAWEQYSLPYPLTVVGEEQVVKPRQIPNVTYRGWVDDTELKRLQNSHLVHLQPSETEGWGHTIHEGLGVNAGVITTEGFADGLGRLRIPSHPYGSRGLATLCAVNVEAVAGAVGETVACKGGTVNAPPLCHRAWFLAKRALFRRRLTTLLGGLA